jgi:hypothetical protein
MRVRQIVGVDTPDEHAAVHELLARFRIGSYSDALLGRLPDARVEILVSSDADDAMVALIVIENGEVAFHPLGPQVPATA